MRWLVDLSIACVCRPGQVRGDAGLGAVSGQLM